MLSGALVSALGIPALAVSRFPLCIGLLLLAARTAALFPQPSDLNPASLPAAPFSAGSGAFYCVFLNYFAIFVRL